MSEVSGRERAAPQHGRDNHQFVRSSSPSRVSLVSCLTIVSDNVSVRHQSQTAQVSRCACGVSAMITSHTMSPHAKLLALVRDVVGQKYPNHIDLFKNLDEAQFKTLLEDLDKEPSESDGSEFGFGDLWDQLPVILAIIQTGLQIIDFMKNNKKNKKTIEEKAQQLSKDELPKQLEARNVQEQERNDVVSQYTEPLAEIAKG
jgi:hypothetical protein